MNKEEKARDLLKKYDQNHINLENDGVIDQILQIDFEQLQELYEETKTSVEIKNIENLEPVKAINPEKIEKEELEKYIKLGEDKIKSGKFAIAIMAGGQGSRLGHKGPKGTYMIHLNLEDKTLFEVAV